MDCFLVILAHSLLGQYFTKNFYEFKVEDFEIKGYDYNKEINLGRIPVAT